jgi:hypothetical protein
MSWRLSCGRNRKCSMSALGSGMTAMIALPRRAQAEVYVQSSIQFTVYGLDETSFLHFMEACRSRGVSLKWFGNREAAGYTSLPG